jgi:heme exporter protein B
MNVASFIRDSLRLTLKDLMVEFRRPYELLSIITFTVSSILIVSFNWRNIVTPTPQVVSIVLWIITFFSSILILTTSFSREVDRGTIEGLRSIPVYPESVLLSKFIYGFTLMSTIILISILSSIVFMNVDVGYLLSLIFVFFFGYLNLMLVGSMISALLIYSEGKTLLMSFLLLPASIPVLIPSTQMTADILDGLSLLETIPEIRILSAYFLLILVASVFLFPHVFSE